jgi:8-oxo-dGTP diphosphatase
MADYVWVRVGVKGAILRDGRLLLLHRRKDLDVCPGLWDLPGGGVEQGATLEGTLVREVREQTGFRVRVGPILYASMQPIRVRGDLSFPTVRVCSRCNIRSRPTPQLDVSEHSGFAWVTRRSLGKLRVVPNLRPAMEKALEGPDQWR